MRGSRVAITDDTVSAVCVDGDHERCSGFVLWYITAEPIPCRCPCHPILRTA